MLKLKFNKVTVILDLNSAFEQTPPVVDLPTGLPEPMVQGQDAQLPGGPEIWRGASDSVRTQNNGSCGTKSI
jgi:hypothetical protein